MNQVENANEIIANKKDPKELGITANGKYKLTVKLTKAVPYFKQLLACRFSIPLIRLRSKNTANFTALKQNTASTTVLMF